MKSEKLLREELLQMQKEKGKICVSIIVPTHKLSPERRVDKLEVKRAIKNAKDLLQYKYSESNIEPILKSIDDLYETIDFTHNSNGLGLYVSPNTRLVVQFPFAIEEKVMVGDNFEVRDLLYKINYSSPYFVLLLTQKEARLFEGSFDALNELADDHFPKVYEEEYIYNTPSRGTSFGKQSHVKSFERDKSKVEEIRFKDFFRHIDELLKNYLTEKTPLILLAVDEELSWFKDVSVHKHQIINKIEGSYNYSGVTQIAEMVWPVMQSHLQNEVELLVKEFEEKIGEHLGISSVQEVWRASKEGRGLKLLVEKDFCCPGFVEKETNHLYLKQPQKPYSTIADAVDEIIEMVLEKNGQVFFTENGRLKDYDQIALIARY